MPGAQDRWGQLTEPGAPRREMAADLPQGVDRPERGSLAEMRQRLERLPPGHPSSPYNDDLTRKPPVARLKDLELPLHGNEQGANGAATYHEPGQAEDVHAAASSETASSNGTSGRSPAASPPGATDRASTPDLASTPDWASTPDSASTPDWTGTPGWASTPDWASAPDWARTPGWGSTGNGGGTADGLDSLNGGLDDTAGEPDSDQLDGEADGDRLDTDEPDSDQLDSDELDSDELDSDELDSDELDGDEMDGAANGFDGAPDWLSTPDWSGTTDLGGTASMDSVAGRGRSASWDGAAGWDGAPDRDGAYQDNGTGPGWAEPELAVDTLTHPIINDDPEARADEPLTGADGSWEWNGRYLTPDEGQVAEEALGRCRIAEGRNVFGTYGHSGLTPAMRRIEAQLEHGRLVPDTESSALKPADSFKEKLADLIMRHPDKSAEELALEVHDGIRYAFIVETEHYAEATLQAHSRLKGSGFDLEVRRNCWASAEYKGINTRWRDPAHDLVFEVQFHTTASWDARQRAHALYEAITDPATPPEERERLRAVYSEMSASVSMPPGGAAIPDYRKEGQ